MWTTVRTPPRAVSPAQRRSAALSERCGRRGVGGRGAGSGGWRGVWWVAWGLVGGAGSGGWRGARKTARGGVGARRRAVCSTARWDLVRGA